MTHDTATAASGRALGTIGIFLLLVLTKLVDVSATPATTLSGRVRLALARLGLGGISAIGTAIDRLTLPRPLYEAAGGPSGRLEGATVDAPGRSS